MSRYFAIALLFVLILATAGCRSTASTAKTQNGPVTVAAAANLTEVLQHAQAQFESQTGIHAVFSFGSTAQLTRQVENSAPFDVLMAADAEHIDELDRNGLLVPGSRAVYATGVLALWAPPGSRAKVTRMEDLLDPEVRAIAVAKPELAPYGRATVESLQRVGIWDKVSSKIVYAENISMAKQYGTSNNADVVFTAYSLVLHEGGTIIQVDEKVHQPIVQELGIVASSKHQDAAKEFVKFWLNGGGRAVLSSYGYRLPTTR